MLRAVIAVLAAILMCTGVVLIAVGVPVPGWQGFALGLLVLAAILFERWRYQRAQGRPNGEWQGTDERFVDPTTGEPVQVFFNPRTGERRYVTGSGGTADPPP
jgi:uncharacterized protein (DUF58 family)